MGKMTEMSLQKNQTVLYRLPPLWWHLFSSEKCARRCCR